MSDDDLHTLLQQAHAINEERNITSSLVYGDSQFMQIIGGEESVLAARKLFRQWSVLMWLLRVLALMRGWPPLSSLKHS